MTETIRSEERSTNGAEATVTLVAIGASAGGLEAIEQFFAAVETPSRLAFVIIQHLSPDFKSLMVELLARRASLAVREIEDGMAAVPGTIHLIPPGGLLTVEGGLLRLASQPLEEIAAYPIDEFFVSLAADRGAEAIGVILSGSGGDGSRGARAITAAGGRVLVQPPATAKFPSMPQSVIETGCPVEIIAPELMARALLVAPHAPLAAGRPPAETLPRSLIDCLARAFGIDLAAYREDAMLRRLRRRMMLRGFDNLDGYAAFVEDDPDEQEALFQALLVGATGPRRDHAAFAALEREVVPALAARLDAGGEARLWVAACATGEEAYALAMLLLDASVRREQAPALTILATDLHRRSLAVAEAGLYGEEALGNFKSAWLDRFLTRHGSGRMVSPAVRRTVSVSSHDLLRDPPFPALDLIVCRGFIGNLKPERRLGVIDMFATALVPGGYVLLDQDETMPEGADGFVLLDAASSLYRRRRRPLGQGRGGIAAPPAPAGTQLALAATGMPGRERRDPRVAMVQQIFLDRHAPPSLLVDEAGQVVHCFGDADAYLAPPTGRPSLAVADIVVEALAPPLAEAIKEVARTGVSVAIDRLPLDPGPEPRLLRRLTVEPLPRRTDGQRCLLVIFEEHPPWAAASARLAHLEAVTRHLLDTQTEATAIADGTLRLIAANARLAALAAEAGATTPLEGQKLADILASLLARPSIDEEKLEQLRRGDAGSRTWITPTGATLTIRAASAGGENLFIVELAPPP